MSGNAPVRNPKLAWSGRRDSNPRRSPWKGDALPAELLPQIKCELWNAKCGMITLWHSTMHNSNFAFAVVGRGGFEPPKVKTGRFTVCCVWPLRYRPSMSTDPVKPRRVALFSIGIIECGPGKVAREGVEFQMKPIPHICSRAFSGVGKTVEDAMHRRAGRQDCAVRSR